MLPETHPPSLNNIFSECASNDDVVSVFLDLHYIIIFYKRLYFFFFFFSAHYNA